MANLRSSLTGFNYQALDHTKREIRLLKLRKSDKPEHELKCEIKTFQLDKVPPYRALSYAWGDPTDTRSLVLGGRHHDVTKNLHAALKVIRDIMLHPEYLWVDAICTNQGDIAEKSYQIPLMEEIYSDAESVLVWLGEGSPKSATAIKFIKECAKAWNLVMEHYPDLRSDSSHQDLVQLAMMYLQVTGSADAMDEANWEAVNEFAKMGLWNRVWIVQEVSLANAALLLCGTERMLLEDPFVSAN
ncbi:heterokaryon incompatibility protein-domain-containing protein [Phaeosphaeriaceae sp. PMI808]|nr:heterokaryon incompatibility protein-domain-containing protein [Phaeosphaeriaceae sp. PMI808]